MTHDIHGLGETVIHLLFRYSPFVHPKFVLKRKDLTFEALNAVDNEGYSAALRCAARNRGQAVHKVLSSKNVKGTGRAKTVDMLVVQHLFCRR